MYGKHIVGRKTETYLTAERSTISRASPWHVTQHIVTTELHATKGWRRVSHQRRTQVRAKLPSMKEWRLNDVTTFKRTMPRKDPVPDYSHMYDPLRHPWQRRKAGWDALRALLDQEAA